MQANVQDFREISFTLQPLCLNEVNISARYSESIRVLYTRNIFEFSNTWSLPYLHPTIRPDLFSEIHHVELRWAFPGHWLPSMDSVKSVYFSAGQPQWIETCQAVLAMRGLQTFSLILEGNWFAESVEKIPVFLEPLRNLRLGREWTLVLPDQPYYAREVERIGEELKDRGAEAVVRVG